jgi:hypothetical protein
LEELDEYVKLVDEAVLHAYVAWLAREEVERMRVYVGLLAEAEKLRRRNQQLEQGRDEEVSRLREELARVRSNWARSSPPYEAAVEWLATNPPRPDRP